MNEFFVFMLYSSLEFLALILFILSVFRFKLKYFILEIISSTVVMALFSYLLIVLEMQKIILIIQSIALIFIFRSFFKQKLLYSIIVIPICYIAYALIQSVVVGIATYYNYLEFDDLVVAFTQKGYVIQTITAAIVIIISAYIKVFNGGFGFSIKKKTPKAHLFLLVTIASMVIISLIYYACNTSSSYVLFILCFTSILISVVALIMFSNNHNRIEIKSQ